GLPDDPASDNAIEVVRFDWDASDGETRVLRLDGRWTSQQPPRLGALALPPTGGTMMQSGGGIMASLTSYFGGNFINEARGYLSTSSGGATAYVSLPAGHAQVATPTQSVTHPGLSG